MYNKNLIILLLLFTKVSTASNFSEIDPNLNDFSKSDEVLIDNELNQALNQGLTQLNHFEHTLEYLSLLIFNEASKFDQSEAILDYIKDTRKLIAQIKDNSFIVPDLNTISLITDINQELSNNLQTALTTNQWKPIDLGLIIKRTIPDDLSMLQIQANLTDNQKILEQLEANVERFGLSSSQKLVRNLEDFYTKCRFYIEEHKLENKIKYSLMASLVAAYCVYHSKYLEEKFPITKKLWHNPVTNLFKKFVGSSPEYIPEVTDPDRNIAAYDSLLQLGLKPEEIPNMLTNSKYKQAISNPEELKCLGELEALISSWISTDTTPEILIPGVVLGWLAHETFEKSDSIMATYGLYLSKNPTVRMMAITNNLLDIKNSSRYKSLKLRWSNWLKQQYAKLRGKSSRDGLAQKPTKTFDDLIGLEQAKKEFEPVIDYIINPDKFDRSKITQNKGYLMIGAPRTGKSFVAQAICGEINKRQNLLGKPKTTSFISIDAAFISDASFYDIMEYINQHAPCIVFIDEIDLLALNRGNGTKENKLLSQILTHMSGKIDFDPDDSNSSNNQKQVIFIAATNNPHNLDPALLQSGRFGKIIAFNYPKLHERKTFMQQELGKRSIILEESFIDEICQELEGNSFEDLSLIITGAIQKASSAYVPVNETHFRATIEETIKGVMAQSQTLSAHELSTISSYQAGKALVTKLLVPNLNISTVTTKPINKKIISKKDGNTTVHPVIEQGGLFTYKNDNLLDLKNTQDLIQECQITLAGHVAQELIMGSSCYAYRAQDQQIASQIAKIIALEGEDYEKLTPDLKEAIIKKAFDIKNECKQKVRELLNANLDKLNSINQALLDKTHLGEKEFNNLLA